MSQLEVDKVIPQSGTTLTLGESGDTVSIPSGATFTPTLTAPIIDEINDNNGNEEIIFTTTTSAVNELTIANAATGNAPEIAATGDDTDIDLKLTPKGAGNLVLDGIEFPNADGSANQVLQTNGSGVLSFATVGGGTQEFDAGTASLPSITTTGDTNTGIFFPSADTIAFTEGGAEAMRIDSSGNVGIGATSISPAKIIVVANVGPDSAYTFRQDSTSTDSYDMTIYKNNSTQDNRSARYFTCVDNTAGRLIIYGDGDVENHDNSYGALSDVRIKQDIRDSNSQWNDIKNIRVRNFKKKDDVRQYGENAWEQIGVIAQELETVSPKLIKHTNPTSSDILSDASFGTLYQEGDEIPEGKKVGDIKEVYEQVKGVSYSVLYMKAIKALQEAMERIEQLEAKNTSLEARLTALENN